MIGLDKTKTNWCDRERIGTILFLASFLVAARLSCEGDCRTEFTVLRDIIDLFISVLLCYKSNFRQTFHLYSRAPPCFARTRILLAVFCNQILTESGEMSKRHLMEGSDWWNNKFISISSAINSTWVLKEMSRITNSSVDKNFRERTVTATGD